ncbi:MAG: hypothetical protein U5M53_04450 [Rhodoferax sp.]|nr:hypothetical protein [Rhodoferax sp.]
MSKIGFLVVSLTLLVLMVLSVWRERRGARWRSMGLCHQCGAPLRSDAKSILLRFNAPSSAVVVCGGCAKERTIRRWLAGGLALMALVAFTVWWFVRQA